MGIHVILVVYYLEPYNSTYFTNFIIFCPNLIDIIKYDNDNDSIVLSIKLKVVFDNSSMGVFYSFTLGIHAVLSQ